jgi:hypothetical protein
MIVNGTSVRLRQAVRLTDSKTGIVMDVSTTQPAVQLHSDNIEYRTVTGKCGKVYRIFYSMSLALQLRFSFEMSTSRMGLVSASPE